MHAKETAELTYQLQLVEYKHHQAKLLFTAKLKDNWKLYWRHPGDGGLPLELEMKSQAQHIENTTIFWPAPTRFVAYETIETYGYKKQISIPIVVQFAPQDGALRLQVTGQFGVCDEICVFHNLANHFTLQEGFVDAKGLEAFKQAMGAYPRQDGALSVNLADVGPDTLSIHMAHPTHQFTNPDLFIELNDNVRFSKPTFRLENKRHIARFTVPYEILLSGERLAEKTLRLTLVDGDTAFDSQVSIPELALLAPDAATHPTEASGLSRTIWAYILFAFLGGLILNVMPCVLPVLALKSMHVVHMDRRETGRVRMGFFITSLGILCSFLCLALVVIGLGLFGAQVGWGFHFQSPIFVAVLCAITLIFGLSQLGAFEVMLPYKLNGALNNIGAGESVSSQFLAGVTATLLATPCTAPFLGSAVGFALQAGSGGILAIFMAIGLGLAAPYLLVALFPSVIRLLPKPGPWMLWVKRLFGVMLLATALWLGWILKGQLFPADDMPLEQGWKVFSAEQVTQQVENGHTVFVDLTASWCLTCKFNKKTTLDTDGFKAWAKAEEVLLLRGDYSQGDKEIYAFLRQHQRAGVPFNAVFSPLHPQGIVLPEILTLEKIKHATQ